jgi:hypothetical protein
MKTVHILRDTIASGLSLKAGEIKEVSDYDAATLCAMGKAEKVDKKIAPAKSAPAKPVPLEKTDDAPKDAPEKTDDTSDDTQESEGDEASGTVLDKLSKQGLVDYADSIGLPNLSGLNKKDIIAAIHEYEKTHDVG